MEKFFSKKYPNLKKDLPFSYFSTDLYLDFAAYTFKRHEESLIVWQDLLYTNEFPCIFLPQKKVNWTHCSIALATAEDVKNIKKENIDIIINKPMGFEFFYSTENFIKPKGSFKSRVHQFATSYKYKLHYKYNKKSIIDFYNFWQAQREHESITFEEQEEFFIFCLNNLKKYNIKQIYVEVDKKLVGLAWGIKIPKSQNWIGLHLKVDYKYKGLSRFLHHERAKIFKDSPEFSLGMGAQDKGIEQYKQELNPTSKKAYFYLLTGDKK